MIIEWATNRLAKEIGYAEAAAEMKEMNRRRKWLRLPVNLPRLGSELSFEYAKLK
jgi:hypothetical protein